MKKESLQDCLNDFFCPQYLSDLEQIKRLKQLNGLISYYIDEGLNGEFDFLHGEFEILRNFRALNDLLLDIEFNEKIKEILSHDIPNSFHCDIEARSPEYIPHTFNFSPVINPPAVRDISSLEKRIENINKKFREIDIIGLILYVKKKAIAAGDFVLE